MPDAEPPVMSRRFRILLAGLVAAGVAVFAFAAVSGDDDGTDISVTGSDAVEALIPGRDDEVLQQQPVGVDLAPEYRLTSLRISPTDDLNQAIEVIDEVDVTDGLNRYVFQPDDGRPIESLAGATNCAIATWELIARPDETGTIDWCFEVV